MQGEIDFDILQINDEDYDDNLLKAGVDDKIEEFVEKAQQRAES